MSLYSDSNSIASIIQLAVAPVFLLAGIAGFLAVMSGRLGRIIDRERVIARRIASQQNDEQLQVSQQEHRVLMKRARITNRAIGLCTSSALVVCALITSLFVDDFFNLGFSKLVVTLFILALMLLIFALLLFLREIQLATQTLKIAKEPGGD
ncbi:MAG: DUF2721 domain-containing protein [Pseudomonadales bacterium]|nr:DUF2721 domain-containing protein [Gammaproteobacteria bacterium]NNL56432.1 DUF2721 domain-containing protein [Pseudomonadales bacterium]